MRTFSHLCSAVKIAGQCDELDLRIFVALDVFGPPNPSDAEVVLYAVSMYERLKGGAEFINIRHLRACL